MRQYKGVISASHDNYGKVTTNATFSVKVKLITWNGQVSYCCSKSVISISFHSALCKTIVWKSTKISCQSFLNEFAGNYSSGECVLVWLSVCAHVFTHKCLSLFAFLRQCANDARRATEGEGDKTNARKGGERSVLTVCCHPAWCLLFGVCMVLTSSLEKFCQVWSGLTFSLSRHVCSSPIPIKISTLCLPVSLLPAQTCITFSILPHLHFLPLSQTVVIILSYMPHA